MTKLLSSLITKLLAIIIILLFVVGFREMILTDDNTFKAFSALMGTLPFAKVIAYVVCKIMKYQYSIPILNSASLLSDFLRLAIMACLQPLIVGILSSIFLTIPKGPYYIQEEYMDGLGYKVKELIIKVITAPIIAIVSAYLTSYIFGYFEEKFGMIVLVSFSVLTILIFSLISIIPFLNRGIALGTAILWRFLVTLLSKMATTVMTNALCLAVYLAILGGVQTQIAGSIIALILCLIIMDFAMQCLKRAIVS